MLKRCFGDWLWAGYENGHRIVALRVLFCKLCSCP